MLDLYGDGIAFFIRKLFLSKIKINFKISIKFGNSKFSHCIGSSIGK